MTPPTAEVDPDEQPTGEFPAITPADLAAADAADAAARTTDPAPAVPEPALEPEPVSSAEPAPTSELQPESAHDLYVPAPAPTDPQDANPFDPPAVAPLAEAPAEDIAPPDPTPAWPVVPPPPVKPPTSVPAPGYVAPSASTPSVPPVQPKTVRPIWLDPPTETAAPAATDAPSSDTPGTDLPATPLASGPTLSPPVLPKKQPPEPTPDASADGDTTVFSSVGESDESAPAEPATTAFSPVEEDQSSDTTTAFSPVDEPTSADTTTAFSLVDEQPTTDVTPESITGSQTADTTEPAIQDIAEPSTPQALNDALALPDEDEAVDAPVAPSEPGTPAEPASLVSEPSAERETEPADRDATPTFELPSPEPAGESDTQRTLISDAVVEPPKRLRLTRPGFLKRATEQPDHAEDHLAEPAADPAAADAETATNADAHGAPTGDEPSPVPVVDEPTSDATEPSTTASDDDAVWDSVVAAESGTTAFDAQPAATKPDPGSITSRIAAIGRLGKRKSAPAGSDDSSDTTLPATTTDAPADAPATPAADPAPEPAPAALLTAEPVPYKPSFAERAALRRRAKSLRGRRDAGLLELGAIVLDQSRFGDPSGGSLVRRRTSDLADLDSEIAAIEIALDDERSAETVKQLGVVHCPSCSSLLGPADRFCANCGTANPGPGDDRPETSAS